MQTTSRRAALAETIVLAALVAGLGGCCVGGPDHLVLHAEGGPPDWGGVTVASPEPVFRATFDEGDSPAGPLFELYDGSSTPVVLAVDPVPWDENPDQDGACPHTEQLATVSAPLVPGDYVLVHRRANGTGDPPSCDGACPWTLFEGEEALVSTLRVVASVRGPTPARLERARVASCRAEGAR